MSDIRKYINLVEGAQVSTEVDEALSPFKAALAGGAVAAATALGTAGAMRAKHMGADYSTPSLAVHSSTPSHGKYDKSGLDDMFAKAAAQKGPTQAKADYAKKLGVLPTETRTATAEDKQEFVSKMLPIIRAQNEKILTERRKVRGLMHKHKLTREEQEFLEAMFKKYRVKNGDFRELLSNINIIPASLVLAQSAIESGWGLSRLAQAGNAMFGQKGTGDKTIGTDPEDGTSFAAYDDAADSVGAYMRNLNSHPAYKELRDARNTLLSKGKKVSGKALAKFLTRYSTRPTEYPAQVSNMIDGAGFERFDG